MVVVTGVAGLSKLIGENWQKWGLGGNVAQEIAGYVNKANIESALGEANDGSGNGVVFGTWQMDVANTQASNPNNIIDKLERGAYSSLPKEAQQKMAAEYKKIRAANDGNEAATLKNQTACLIATIALQAENQDIYKNTSVAVDVKKLLEDKPDLTFAVRYTMHQLPPEQGAAVVGAMATKEGMTKNIAELVPDYIRNSNPSTYEGVVTVADFVAKLDSKKVTSATASAGITLPSNNSISAVTLDLKAAGQEKFGNELKLIEEKYKNRSIDEADKTQIAKALNELQQHINKLFEDNKVELDAKSQMLAVHLGPYSAVVALKADDNQNVKDATLRIGERDVKISKESYDIFAKELSVAGIEIAAYETAKIGDLKKATEAFYAKQLEEAKKIQEENSAGTLSASKKKDMDFFAQMIDEMSKQNPIMAAILMFVGMLTNIGQDADAPKQEVAPPVVATAPAAPTVNPSTPIVVADASHELKIPNVLPAVQIKNLQPVR